MKFARHQCDCTIDHAIVDGDDELRQLFHRHALRAQVAREDAHVRRRPGERFRVLRMVDGTTDLAHANAL